MSTHHASIAWSRSTPDFDYERYSRDHETRFGGGAALALSAAPEFKGDGARANPEELLVSALASCHMLTFLAIAARKGIVVDAYEDEAEGVLEKNAEGQLAVTRVTLRPKVRFAEPQDAGLVERLHASAHRGCFIANSVRTDVAVEPR